MKTNLDIIVASIVVITTALCSMYVQHVSQTGFEALLRTIQVLLGSILGILILHFIRKTN